MNKITHYFARKMPKVLRVHPIFSPLMLVLSLQAFLDSLKFEGLTNFVLIGISVVFFLYSLFLMSLLKVKPEKIKD